jgi:methionyl-tRNA formyltransferase
LRVWDATEIEAPPASAAPGTILSVGRAGIDVVTGRGVLRLQKIQPPSARVMDVEAYLAAHPLGGVAFVS